MSPYVITTKRPNGTIVRHATDTPGNARGLAEYELRVCGYFGKTRKLPPLVMAARKLPESGGTVGPLPDGTVIEVEPVTWTDLADRADCFPVPWSHEKIIDAFNAL